MEVIFQGKSRFIISSDDLHLAFSDFLKVSQFELWLIASHKQSLLMLRDMENAWLMYLSFNGDSGFVSFGDETKNGLHRYILTNGDVNEIPLSWCIDIKLCYRALAHFFITGGSRYEFIRWHQSDH